MKRKVLGRGLDALIPTQTTGEAEMILVDIDRIRPNRYQPRQQFDRESLEELATSIRDNGVIQPLILRPDNGSYELIAGERRWRAAQLANLQRVPAVIKSVSDDRLLELALVENIQREDLGPLEVARGYRLLMDEYSFTQEQVSQRVGKKRSSVANHLRLLELGERVRQLLSQGKIEMGHARAIAGLKDPEAQEKLADRVARKGLSVRECERMVERARSGNGSPGPSGSKPKDPNVRAAEEALGRRLGTPVQILSGTKGGKIQIDYKSAAELHRIYDLILSIQE